MTTPAALRVWGTSLAVYKRIWRSNAFGSLLQPFLYLLGMGLGVGSLVDRGAGNPELLDGVTYLAFLAPALIATTAMMTSATESLWPLMDGFMWSNSFRAMTATPLTPGDIVAGAALWNATRALIASGSVGVVLVAFDDTRAWGLVPAVGAGVLCGLAFAGPITAWTSTRERDISFPAIMRFGIIPMFLFAGAFFPVDQLPAAMRPIAYATPLYHGVELCRGLVLDRLTSAEALAHTAVLAGYATAGYGIARLTFTRRLHQ